ncbi:phage protein NinX family protein [Salmonella enterica]|uniref:phage protein NinX family protein n=1 Tax=Salmonella enterica TaxID=28901 RepID=UPI00352A3D95
MDYSQLSDFEINKRVAEVIYKDRDGLFVARNLPSREEVTIVAEINSEDICIAAADYCNNPADAWPIITGNHISLMHDESLGKWCAGKPYWVDGCEWQLDIDVTDENPLRAAMIFFLMMQDAKHA